MEEDILKILKENYFEKIPKLIASHITEFIEWLIYSDDIETYETWGGKWFQTEKGEDAEHYTLEGIYQYWLKNVKK